jgi:C-terminal processing protease CtpA/Prc
MEKTSAASCGIKIGDVITHIDDARVGQGTPTSRFVGKK